MKPTYEDLEKKVRSLEKRIGRQSFQHAALKDQEITQAAVLSNIPMFMMIADPQGGVEKASNLLLEFAGIGPKECEGLMGGEVLRCIHHLDDPKGCGFGPWCDTCKIRQTVLNTIETGTPHFKVEAKFSSLDEPKGTKHLLLSTVLLRHREKKALVFIEDITDQKISKTALKEQTDFLNALIETITNPIFYKDSDGYYTGCNKAFEDFTGRPRSDIIGKTVYDLGPKEIADKYYEKDRELFENPGKQRYEWKVKTPGNSIREAIFDKATLHDVNGNVTGLVGVISDVTERKHSEDLVRKLSQMLIQTQERERKRISCELHDGIAQNLSTLKLYCTRMYGDQVSLNKNIKDDLNNISDLIDQTVKDVRDLAYDLRPSSLDHLGLVHSLEVFCEEFSKKHNIVIDFQSAGLKGLSMAPEMEINLYRLVHEGLNNVRKHAKATKAVIKLVGAYPHIILRIEDNGRGFDVKKRERSMIREKRMGLWSMKERANLLQGKMTIHSQVDKGTRILIKLLLEDEREWTQKNGL